MDLRVAEVELTKERKKTRLMKKSLRSDQAALERKERELSMLLREKDQILAIREAEEKLVADFLEADDGNKNVNEKAMLATIVALISPDSGVGKNGEGFGGVYGGNLNHQESTPNEIATFKGTKGDEK